MNSFIYYRTSSFKKRIILFRLAIILISLYAFSIPVSSQGLRFYSNNELIANRTSYEVFHNKAPVFQDYLSMSFDISILDPGSFGFIFHLVDEENGTYYNLTHTSSNPETSVLKLNFSNQTNLLEISVPKSKLGSGQWNNLSVVFDAFNNNITITFLGETYSVNKSIDEFILDASVFFGKYGRYIDLPDMAIRNLTLADNHQTFRFIFNEIDGSDVHAENGNTYGRVENPYWLINDSYYWKHIGGFKASKPGAVSFDEVNQQFILVTSDSITTLNPQNGELITTKLAESPPLTFNLGMSFWDNENNEWILYELNNTLPNPNTVASFDLESQSWRILSNDHVNNIRHHHVGFFDSQTKDYMIFGGYGNAEYLNEFNALQLNQNGNWQNIEFSGDNITPRFFSGLIRLNDDELILFGGAGNPTGDQSLGKIYYTDCYLINPEERVIKKLWDIKDFEKPMVSVRDMILSPDSTHFYTLYYPEYIPNTYLKLYKFSIEDGSYEVLGDSLPMNSERIETNANLYLNPVTEQIYCVTQEFAPDGSSQVMIYSISYPPVSGADFFKEHNEIAVFTSTRNILLFIVLPVALGIILFLLFYRRITHARQKRKQIKKMAQQENTHEQSVEKIKKNAVYLFGEFTAYDAKGNDISHLFSPKIKQLFFLILFKSKSGGVSSYEIYDALWPDKPKDKAKNTKGVTLNLLRKILVDFDGIELHYENKNLAISSDEAFYCDYLEFLSILEKMKQETVIDDKSIKRLAGIVSNGSFMACTDYEYFDQFKQIAEDEILSILPQHIELSFKNEDFLLTISLSKIMLKIDPTHEVSFHFLIASYANIDLPEKARKRYNVFSLNYKKETDNEFPYTFKELYDSRSLKIIREHSTFY
jgi:two-component SAPR family response regulator